MSEAAFEARYDAWLRALFDHDEARGDWRFDLDWARERATENTDADNAAFVTRLLTHIPRDLAAYSDWQIALGISAIFDTGCTDCALALREGIVPIAQRVEAIHAINHLYADCYAPRCAPVLGHLSETGNPLNMFCYMIWDITPLSYCEGIPHRGALYEALTDVMAYALTLPNVACMENGLHGLGHMVAYYPPASEPIRRFIQQAGDRDPRLIAYGRAAARGCIQ